MAVSTQMTIRDAMTSKLKKMAAATDKLNSSLKVSDRLTKTVDVARGFNRAAPSIGNARASAEKFNREQKNAEEGAKKVKSAWAGVSGYISAAMAGFGIKKILDLADSMTTTTARLNMMNDGMQTTAELQDMIMQSANRSRAAYQSTADAVAKLGITSGDAFDSNKQLIAFAETINKQFAIAGTSAEGQSAAWLQLTQAMGSGVLRGEELNSIFEQAPTIIQTISDYLGVPIGQIRNMAAEGQITAEVVKNAMLENADVIDKRFQDMPMTFSQAWTVAKNVIIQALTPVLNVIAKGAQFIYDNWSTIAPIFWGLAAAVVVYAGALALQTAATWLANAASIAFSTTLMGIPLIWIALAIGIVVMMIYNWIQSVGGLRVAWLICVDKVLTGWNMLKIAFFTGVNFVLNSWNNLQLGFMRVSVGIQNVLGDMKAGALMILQDMVNGAIRIINGLISAVNHIPGVSIEAIKEVTFGTNAKIQNAANKQARADDLAAYQSKIENQISQRNKELDALKASADASAASRKAEIAAAKASTGNKGGNSLADMLKGFTGSENGGIGSGGNLGDIGSVGNVGSVDSINDEVNIAEEDLQFLRDVAEMRYVQNFVTLTPTVAVEAAINETVDIDDVVGEIEMRLENEFVAAAEGVYN